MENEVILSKEAIDKLDIADRIKINGRDFISKEYAVRLCEKFAKKQLSGDALDLANAVLSHINSRLKQDVKPEPSLNKLGCLAFDLKNKIGALSE